MSRWSSFWRGVGMPVGAVVIGVGFAMLLCGFLGLGFAYFSQAGASRNDWAQAFALTISAAVAVFSGTGLRFYGRNTKVDAFSRREAIFAVAVIWLTSGLFGALPYLLSAGLSPIDSLFEAVSGFTTTGATVITDIESRLSRPLLLWRSVTQWLGGMGIVVLFVAIFPNLGVGAKFMFRGEAPGAISQGLKPRIADTSSFLWRLYVLFTATEFGLLWMLGMSPFESLCHSLTTMSTGGFSTRDGSIGAFNSPAIEMVIALFMLLAGTNFGLYYAAIRGRSLLGFFRSAEFRLYLLIIVSATAVLTVSILSLHGTVLQAFRFAFFQVATFITSTGYGTDAYMAYPSAAISLVLFLMFVGGCSGSTAGGMKIERVVLLAKVGLAQIRSTFRPNVIQIVRMGRKRVPSTVLSDVAVFFAVFMGCLGVCVFAVAAVEGIPVHTSFGATLSCLSNMGPAPFHVGDDTFAGYGFISKLLFAFSMILGRLEFFTVFALFIPDFWRR